MTDLRPMNEAERSAGLPATPGYRYAERVGDQLFVAGQVPHDTSGQIVGLEDPQAQARQCLKNLKTLLSVHDFPTSSIRRLVVYVVGSHADLAAVWSVVEDWFGDGVPPATLLGVAMLGHQGQLVEVDATVIKP